ncbi:hypothetical protein [Endozoicomonas sp. ISHI1]|uniref:hypothetical protein n=1 Tax=Endozoicomonas sp. ISHI1 TaxID=2825882 RepID=UPI0021476848|nr:hypothetical protein [Endozoicomonas sp. ISHI1]
MTELIFNLFPFFQTDGQQQVSQQTCCPNAMLGDQTESGWCKKVSTAAIHGLVYQGIYKLEKAYVDE